MKIFAFFLVTFGFAGSVFAGEGVCFSNRAEYYKYKSQLPSAFQTVPVAFSGMPKNTVAMKAKFNSKGKLVINYTYSVTVKVAGIPVTKTVTDTPMNAGRICVNGSSVTMGDYKGTVSGNNLTIGTAAGKMTLVKTSEGAYGAVAQIVSGLD